MYDGPRAQKRPPPGERPGILAELGPQRSDRSLRRSARPLALPVLAEVSGDALDASTVRYLSAAAHLAQRRQRQKQWRGEGPGVGEHADEEVLPGVRCLCAACRVLGYWIFGRGLP